MVSTMIKSFDVCLRYHMPPVKYLNVQFSFLVSFESLSNWPWRYSSRTSLALLDDDRFPSGFVYPNSMYFDLPYIYIYIYRYTYVHGIFCFMV